MFEEGKEDQSIFLSDVQRHTAKALILSPRFKTLRTSLPQFLFAHIPISAGEDTQRKAATQQIRWQTFELENSSRFRPRPPWLHQLWLQTKPTEWQPRLSPFLLAAAQPVALGLANSLCDFCCSLQSWGFLWLLNLSTGETGGNPTGDTTVWLS